MTQTKAKQTVITIAPALHRKLKVLASERGETLQVMTERALIRVYKLQMESGQPAGASLSR